MQQFELHFKICLKFVFFDHCGHAKHKIFPNALIWLSILKFVSNFSILTTADRWNIKFFKIQQFELRWRFYWNLSFLTTADLLNIKLFQIQQFKLCWNFWLKIEFFDHRGPAKYKTFPNAAIWNCVENLTKNWVFKSPRTCKTQNCAKYRYFSCNLKFVSNLTFLTIFSNVAIWIALKIWLKFEFFDHRGSAKHKNFPNAAVWGLFKIWFKF